MKNEQTYPIAEIFASPQGEGAYAGTRMLFVRLAGCNVGRYLGPMELTAQGDHKLKELRVLNPRHSICQSAIGHKDFLCDTDYFQSAKMTPSEILQHDTTRRRVCITGGEPFLHDLWPLIQQCLLHHIHVHIETRGTLEIPQRIAQMCWVTCSPKKGFLPVNRSRISEYKFVIDPSSQPLADILKQIQELTNGPQHKDQLFYIQAINGVNELNTEANQGLLMLQEMNPNLRISIQTHKILGVR